MLREGVVQSDMPDMVYKYREFSNTTIASLCYDQLFFANPATFNDPLDCKPTVKVDSSLEELRILLANLISQRVEASAKASLKQVRLKGSNALNHAKKLGEQSAKSELANIAYMATVPDHDISATEAEVKSIRWDIQLELLNRYDRGICCFSASFNNPLLWSHYSGEHSGFCIGYDFDRIPRPQLHRVQYGGSREVSTSLIIKALVDEDTGSQALLDEHVLLRKAAPWVYEDEWRLFGDVGIQNSPLAMREITFGLRCPETVIYTIVQALSEREGGLKFYKMFSKPGTFQLERDELDFGEMNAYFPNIAMSGEEMFGPNLD